MPPQKNKNSKNAFTLIELLVVISIIALLSVVSFALLDSARVKARNARRLADMGAIQTALDMYYDKYGYWPAITPDACCGGAGSWDQGPCDGDNTFIAALETEGFLKDVPVDPSGGTGNGCYGYAYFVYDAGQNGCTESRGDFYVLGIFGMEDVDISYTPKDGRPVNLIHEHSHMWYCPEDTGVNRDWLAEVNWVVGKFEDD